MKPGDMVMVIYCPEDCDCYHHGLRIGHIGTIRARCDCGWYSDFHVDFPSVNHPYWKSLTCFAARYLRLIPPNEPCESGWDWRKVGEEERV